MLNYLSKFVLQMLPTISATVIGAYIVTTWINPKTPPEQAKIAARAAKASRRPKSRPARSACPADAREPSRPKSAEAKPRSQACRSKPAEAKPAETAETPSRQRLPSAPDKIRIIPIVKQPAQTTETTVASTAPASAPETGRGCRRAEGCQRTGPGGDPAPARRHGDGPRDG